MTSDCGEITNQEKKNVFTDVITKTLKYPILFYLRSSTHIQQNNNDPVLSVKQKYLGR